MAGFAIANHSLDDLKLDLPRHLDNSRTMKNLILMFLSYSFILGLGSSGSAAFAAKKGKPVERVTGIGGFFFKAQDPQALAKWYETHLGIDPTPSSYDAQPWTQESGPTIFTGFPKDTTYFGPKDWMINFRVRNLEAMVKQLREAGIKVEMESDDPKGGSFARLEDPEGNPIQLWEPRDHAKLKPSK